MSSNRLSFIERNAKTLASHQDPGYEPKWWHVGSHLVSRGTDEGYEWVAVYELARLSKVFGETHQGGRSLLVPEGLDHGVLIFNHGAYNRVWILASMKGESADVAP